MEGQGSNVLLHSFQLKDNSGKISEKKFNNLSPTTLNYSALDYLIVLNDGYDNLYYSIDCSGYLATMISAGADVASAEMKISADTASKLSKSLVVIKGLLYSPIYQAVKNEGIFKDNKDFRKLVLQSLLNKIPSSYLDDTKILINSNFEVVLTSNEGSSSFNGKAEMSAGGSYNFIIGSASSSLESRGKIGRTSTFAKFNTYVLNENVQDFPMELLISDLKLLINSL